jgi:hypothetical protein
VIGRERSIRIGGFIVALLACDAGIAGAQAPAWRGDIDAVILSEAWDYNLSREVVAGLVSGVDRRAWRALHVRAEGSLLRVAQRGADAWLTGATLGVRARWRRSGPRAFADLAGGISRATLRVPPQGTAFNFLLVSGVGVAIPMGGVWLDIGARYLHISNNGREGHDRNPDVQSLGVLLAVGFGHR